MALFDLYFRVVKALEKIEAPYVIVGAFAGSIFGIARATADVDIMVDLRDEDCAALSELFPLPRYYADPEMMRSSIQMGIMFNIIDTDEGTKADLVPLKRDPEYRIAFERRVRQTYRGENGEIFEAWFAQPTDIIIGKLWAWNEGRSNKHPDDIYSILFFCLRGFSDYNVNIEEVTKEAGRIGRETLEMWNQILAKAKEEVEKHEK